MFVIVVFIFGTKRKKKKRVLKPNNLRFWFKKKISETVKTVLPVKALKIAQIMVKDIIS